MEKKARGLQINDLDNVATVFGEVEEKQYVEIITKSGSRFVIQSLEKVPYGHKVATKEIKMGEQITKYGEEIGKATQDIERGGYVHVHNLESIRGRGDWQKEGTT